MANNTSLYGFRWVKAQTGELYGPPLERRRVASAYQAAPSATNVDLNAGDPIKYVSDGTIALCAAGDATYGIIAGFGPVDFTGSTFSAFNKKLPGGTTGTVGSEQEIWAYVIPVAGQVFEVDVDDNTTFTTIANYISAIGENCDISINQNGTTKLANPRLSISSHAAPGAAKVWRVHDLAGQWNLGLDVTGTFYKLQVVCNVVQQAPYNTSGT